jgi:hypothetical protein
MLSAENRSFFHLKYSFLRPVCRPVDSASLGGCNTCPHPHSYATRCIGSLFSAWVRWPPLHFRAQRCSYRKCTVRYRGSSEPSKCRVWHVFCHQRPVRISLLLFLGVATTSKEFQWYLIHDVTPASLRLVFCVFFSP